MPFREAVFGEHTAVPCALAKLWVLRRQIYIGIRSRLFRAETQDFLPNRLNGSLAGQEGEPSEGKTAMING